MHEIHIKSFSKLSITACVTFIILAEKIFLKRALIFLIITIVPSTNKSYVGEANYFIHAFFHVFISSLSSTLGQ